MSFPNSPTGMHAFWMGVGCLKFMAVMAWTQRRGLGRERQSVSAWNKPRFQTRGNYGNPSQSSDPLLLCVRPCSRQRIRQWRKEIKAPPSGILQSGRKTTDQKQTHAPWRRMLRRKLQQSKRLGKAEGGRECNLQWACQGRYPWAGDTEWKSGRGEEQISGRIFQMRGTASAKALRKRVPDLFEGRWGGQCGQSRMSVNRSAEGTRRGGALLGKIELFV